MANTDASASSRMRSRIALSYVAAADELNVTPAAVGQLVRRLEEVIGIELFSPFAGRTRAARFDRSGAVGAAGPAKWVRSPRNGV